MKPGATKLFLAGLAAVLLASCAGEPPAPKVSARVWPSPPDEPRIAYVGSYSSPRDIGQSESLLTRAGHWLTGETGENLALRKPFGLALDEEGNLCVTDTGAKTVCLIDLKNKKWLRYRSAGKTPFEMPVAVAKRNGMVYVADSSLGKILAFRVDGKASFAITNALSHPTGLAISGDRLAVVDSQAHAVFIFDLTGKFLFSFGQRGTGDGEFNYPTHVSADGQGRWLVTDSLNCRVQVFSADGKFLSQFGGNSDTPGHFARPKGLAADSAGRIYVADTLFDNFQIFDPQGRLLLAVGSGGGGAAGSFDLPAGVAISADNKIYVADSLNRRIQIFQYIGAP
jgi:DNA-binding beta-propeller fold protein YncE